MVDTDQHLSMHTSIYCCCCIPCGFVCLRANDTWRGRVGGPEDLHSEHIAKKGFGVREAHARIALLVLFDRRAAHSILPANCESLCSSKKKVKGSINQPLLCSLFFGYVARERHEYMCYQVPGTLLRASCESREIVEPFLYTE